MFNHSVDKPKSRSKLRLKVGKEYFILKRKFYWWQHQSSYSAIDKSNTTCCHLHKKYQSILLRQLKDVDMYSQYNKITNLSLAIEKLNGSIIKPKQRFSIWQKVGRPSKHRGFLEGLSLHNGQIGRRRRRALSARQSNLLDRPTLRFDNYRALAPQF